MIVGIVPPFTCEQIQLYLMSDERGFWYSARRFEVAAFLLLQYYAT